MVDCVIHPIPILEMRVDKSMMTYRLNFGLPVSSVAYVWYIQGPNEAIVVDAGVSIEFARRPGRQIREIQTLSSGLRKFGMDFGDVDIVIITHLHHDHVADASRFTQAKLLVQRDELRSARNPHPSFASDYSFFKKNLAGLKFETVDGDTGICDGVSVIKTPGHSLGGQSVSVKTARGTAIIAGLCTVRDNFETSQQATPVIPPGIFTSLPDAYDSLLRIKKTADVVLPLHDSQFLQTESVPD